MWHQHCRYRCLMLLLLLLHCLQTSQSTRTTLIFASNSALLLFPLFFFFHRKKEGKNEKIQYCIVNVSCTSIYLYDIANDVDDVEPWHKLIRTHTPNTLNQSVCFWWCYCARVSSPIIYIFSRCSLLHAKQWEWTKSYKINVYKKNIYRALYVYN